jgi:hypothetical protein
MVYSNEGLGVVAFVVEADKIRERYLFILIDDE